MPILHQFKLLGLASTTIIVCSFATPQLEIQLVPSAVVSAQEETTDAEASTWQEITSLEGNFTVMMPGNPSVESPTNNQDSAQFFLEKEEGKITYTITYNTLPNPEQELTQEQVNLLFDASQEVLVGNGRLLEKIDLELEDYLGREVTAIRPEGSFQARFYWVHPRLYVLLVGANTGTEFPQQEAQGFLSSFKPLAEDNVEDVEDVEEP